MSRRKKAILNLLFLILTTVSGSRWGSAQPTDQNSDQSAADKQTVVKATNQKDTKKQPKAKKEKVVPPSSGKTEGGSGVEKQGPRLFLKLQDRTHLMLGKVPYRNIGVNIPDLFERFLRGDDTSALRALNDAHNAGVHFVRLWGTTWSPDDFSGFETDRAHWFAAFDRMLQAADTSDIALIPSLLFNIHMLPQYVGKSGTKNSGSGGSPETLAQYLTPGTRSNDLALAYVSAFATRYQNDPRVLFWEIGNEYNLEADLSTRVNGRAPGDVVTSDQVQAFLTQIARRLHSLDKHHYVTSGNAEMRPSASHLRAAMLAGRLNGHTLDFAPDWTSDSYADYCDMLALFNPPAVDIISVHQYPPEPDSILNPKGASWLIEDGEHALRFPWTQYAAESLHKPLFIGEVGQKLVSDGKEIDAPWLMDFLKRTQSSEAPLVALWSWEYDTANPIQAPLSLSPKRTPQLTLAVAAINAAILQAAVSNVSFGKTPPLDFSKTAQQEDKIRVQAENLRVIATDVLKAAQRKIGGENVHLSEGSATADTFSVRDAALMLGSDLIGADEIAGWVRLIAAAQAGPEGIALNNGLSVPPYTIPDHLTLGDTPIWFPGGKPGTEQGKGEFGFLPPADNPYYFIQMVREHLRITGESTLFESQVKTSEGMTTIREACQHAFDSVPADANGLVVIGNSPAESRVDWGFADTVRKNGACLVPSILRWRAAKDLVVLFAKIGDKVQIARYDKEVRTIREGIAKTFYHSLGKENDKEVGMLYSATGLGHRDDIWASAYAVWSGALRTQQAEAVTQHLLSLYQAGGTVLQGQARPLPISGTVEGYWEQTTSPKDTYQNGAFWGFPTGWYINTLMRVDRTAAGRMLDEFVTSLQAHRSEGAPWKCIYPATKYTFGPGYCATVVAPYIALRQALDVRL